MAINTEDTIFDGAINEQAKTVAKAVSPKKRAPRKPLTFGQQVAIGGTAGVLFGAAATFAATQLLHPSDDDASDDQSYMLTENGLKVAKVDDDLSFTEAFQTAREAVGPGGAFEWHGNVYGTYTASEWKNLDKQEVADFSAKISESHITEHTAEEIEVASIESEELVAAVEPEVVAVDDEADDVQIVGMSDDDMLAMVDGGDASEGVYLVNIDEPDVVDSVEVDLTTDDLVADATVDVAADDATFDFAQNEMPHTADDSDIVAADPAGDILV